jgi:hypothetical protein
MPEYLTVLSSLLPAGNSKERFWIGGAVPKLQSAPLCESP